MTKQFLKKIGQLTLIIILSGLFLNSCKEPKQVNPPPPSQYCGVGSGDLTFETVGSVDTTFNCNTSGRSVVNLRPNVDDGFIGFNRLDLELVSGGHTYRSNYVEFNSDQEGSQQLEWGGSLPSGTYEIRGILENIQLNSSCYDSIYRVENLHLGNIRITQFTSPSKVMQIEYFCQDSDTGIIDRYDVFLSPHTSEYMNIAFNIANTRDSVITYQTDLPCSLILNTDQAIAEYIYDHKQFDDRMFLCGIKGFKDAQGHLIEKAGSTIWTDTIYFTPSCWSGSLVAVKSIINQCGTLYNVNYNDIITATTIHELGHQRAILHHHDDFGNPPRPFCIMNNHLIYSSFNLYSNPHFCNECINKIKNTNW
ncbi:MAG: hypothetical protein WCE90_10525 [Candidatus Zixiibacteriota bacterium]